MPMIRDRIQGATLPGAVVTVDGDDGQPISDGMNYTWTCQAVTAVARATVWTKTTGITPTPTGFTVAWQAGDMGALTVPIGHTRARYVLRFVGTSAAGVIRHNEVVTILRA